MEIVESFTELDLFISTLSFVNDTYLMDDELFDSLESFGSEPAELKLGSTFSGKGPGFHTLRCKFNIFLEPLHFYINNTEQIISYINMLNFINFSF